MKKIKRPEWHIIMGDDSDLFIHHLNVWYNSNIEPINEMLENAYEGLRRGL